MNFEELERLIRESGKTKTFIAAKLGISQQALYNKLNGKSDFTRNEVEILCNELHISSLEQKENVFFNNNVD